MKKRKLVLLIIGVLVLTFLIITGFNTLTVKSKQPKSDPTEVVINEEEAVQHLSKAITFKTVSYQDRNKFDFKEFDRFNAFLQESFPLVHKQLEFEKVNDYALVYKWKGTEVHKKPVGLTSHYDVVPVLSGTEANWEHDPFSGAVVDGKIWGRGTLDDKIGVIGILQAVNYLLAEGFKPDRDMYFMFGFDEEIGGDEGATAIVNTLKDRGITFDYV
jgi:carboxypeptidase PM20D1